MNIRAIETVYSNCRFRSRLEARWAVLFDCLNMKWEYEPDGFKLLDADGNEIWYLPDFFLVNYMPALDAGTRKPGYRNVKAAWVEIKPYDLSPTEYNKCELLHEMLGQDVYAFCGNIGDSNFIWYYWHYGEVKRYTNWNQFINVSTYCNNYNTCQLSGNIKEILPGEFIHLHDWLHGLHLLEYQTMEQDTNLRGLPFVQAIEISMQTRFGK